MDIGKARLEPYARRALQMQAAGRTRDALLELARMGRDLGGGNIYALLELWMDLALGAQGERAGAAASVALSFYNTDDASPISVDAVDGPTVWAARLLSAHLAGDHATAEALCVTLPKQQRPTHVFAMLRMAAALHTGAGTITDVGDTSGGAASGC
jgi:hypothetical protein